MYSKLLYIVEKSKRVSVGYRLDPETIAKIKAIAAYYGGLETSAVEIALTHELERIDALQARRINLQKKMLKLNKQSEHLGTSSA